MCTYNGAKYLREQLDSILNQTYPIYELIVQDDCSTDETIRILNEYAQKYHIVKVYVNENQKGVTMNFISAIQRAEGDFIAISDQDDIWELQKIEKQVKYIGNAMMCFSLSAPFTNDNIPLNIDKRVPNYDLERLIFYPVIPGHAMLFRRELVNLLPEEKNRSYDGQLAITANAYGRVVVCAEFLTHHRRHLKAVSYVKPDNNKRNITNIISYLMDCIRHYRNNYPNMQTYMHHVHTYMNRFLIKKESLDNALLLSELLGTNSFMAQIKASLLCIKLRDKIFYAPEKSLFVSVVRAALWPILCCKYYKK